MCFFRAYSKGVRCEEEGEGGGGLEVEVELFIAIREVVENVRGDPNHSDPNTEHGYVAAKLLQSHLFVRFPREHSRKHPCLVFLSFIFSLQTSTTPLLQTSPAKNTLLHLPLESALTASKTAWSGSSAPIAASNVSLPVLAPNPPRTGTPPPPPSPEASEESHSSSRMKEPKQSTPSRGVVVAVLVSTRRGILGYGGW